MKEAFDYSEFGTRWAAARIAAASFEDGPKLQTHSGLAEKMRWELELIDQIPEKMFEPALRQVFDNSRKLAASASRYYEVQLELADIQALMQASALPCVSGAWQERPTARFVETKGCPHGLTRNTRACDWYREAIDGVVMGLGETELYVRHQSEAHGDAACVDVFFHDDRGLPGDTTLFAPIPPPLLDHLERLVGMWREKGTRLEWKGYSAGTIYYMLQAPDDAPTLCQDRAKDAHDQLKRQVAEIFPTLRIRDSSPLAVYAEGTR